MPQVYWSHSSGVDSYTRPGSNAVGRPHVPGAVVQRRGGDARRRWIGCAGVVRLVAVVMIADLIAIGDQVGFFDFSSAPMPAMCGLDIEVPDSAS